jgi:hypothetical protein
VYSSCHRISSAMMEEESNRRSLSSPQSYQPLPVLPSLIFSASFPQSQPPRLSLPLSSAAAAAAACPAGPGASALPFEPELINASFTDPFHNDWSHW